MPVIYRNVGELVYNDGFDKEIQTPHNNLNDQKFINMKETFCI